MSSPPIELPIAASPAASTTPGISRDEWLTLARRARWLSWASLAYMGVEGAAALAIAALAVREGIEAWRGESCCVPTTTGETDACTHDCCTPTPTTEILPIAECHLDVAGLRTQADRYRRLGTTATSVVRRSGLLEVTFRDELDETLLNETIAVERNCCPFFAFDYQPDDRRLSITVEQPEQEPALDALHFAITAHDTTSPLPQR